MGHQPLAVEAQKVNHWTTQIHFSNIGRGCILEDSVYSGLFYSRRVLERMPAGDFNFAWTTQLIQDSREQSVEGRRSYLMSAERGNKNICLSVLEVGPDAVDIHLSPAWASERTFE